MKKVFLSLALLAASTVSIMAQSNNSGSCEPQCPNKEQCEKGNCEDGKKCDKKCADKKEGHKKSPKKLDLRNASMSFESMFAGLNLTPEQQTKLAALRDSRQKGDFKKEQGGEKKDDLTPEQKRQMRMERASQQQDDRANMLKQVKEILTPDQYVAFLENFFTQSGDNFIGNQIRPHGDKNFERPGMHRMKDPRGLKEAKKIKEEKSKK